MDYASSRVYYKDIYVVMLDRAKEVHDELNGLKYLKHKPGFVIKENTIRYWCDYLDRFKGWERYVPDAYIPRIIE